MPNHEHETGPEQELRGQREKQQPFSMNRVTLRGTLRADPELRRMPDGKPIASFSVGTTKSWKDRESGEERSRVDYHRVVVYDPQQAAEVGETLKKGATVTVFEGSLRNRTWTDKEGIERQQTEVVISQSQGALLRQLSRGQETPRSEPQASSKNES